MSKKIPFVVHYTQAMSDAFNLELKQSGRCFITNPKFYGKWDLVQVGSPEYNRKVKVKRTDIENKKD